MCGRTHRSGGSLFGLLWILMVSPTSAIAAGIMYISSVFGSLLPDMDHGQSSIAHMLGFISRTICSAIQTAFGHRGIFHSLLFCILYGIGGFILTRAGGAFVLGIFESFGWHFSVDMTQYALMVGMGFAIGSLSHLVYDMANPEGVKPFLPLSKKHISVLPIRTSSPLENCVFYPISIFLNLVVLFIMFKMGMLNGFITSIRFW